MLSCWFKSSLWLTFLVALVQFNFGCSPSITTTTTSDSPSTSTVTKPSATTITKPDLSLIPKIGPHPERTQLEVAVVSPDFHPRISAKDALKIANRLTQGQISTKQPEKIRVDLVPESQTSNRKIWAISYFGEGISKPLPPWRPPPSYDKKGNILPDPPPPPTPKPVRTVFSIGIDPDTGKSHGIVYIPEAAWKSWRPPTKEDLNML